VRQYAGLLRSIGSDGVSQPRTFEHGKLDLVPPSDWVSGFFPGALWLIYEHTGSEAIRTAAEDFTRRQLGVEKMTHTHDLGFMLQCSFGEAYRVTGDPVYRDRLIEGARSLATRCDPAVGLIRSWDFGSWKYPVIIDNMMNLELLMFAHAQTGEPVFRQVAVGHAEKTLANHFRPDASSYHLVDYDPKTGQAISRETVQGYANESSWARGQGWALYGYTRMAMLTGKPEFLALATRIAEFILAHPRLPADGVPYWDFDLPHIPDALRDASAAAVICVGLLDLAGVVGGGAAGRYRALAERQLRTLSTAAFRAGLDENGNFLLMHSVGFLAHGREVDTPLAYADYYFLEALARYAAKVVPPKA
jgi:rhamnogalacturonyl hydrolase YesR